MGAEAPRLFRLVRTEDESGVSGTGHVADGVAEADIAATRAALLAPGHHAVGRGGVVLSWSHDIPEAIRAKLRAAVVADAREHGDHTPHAYDPPMDVRGECERVAMLNRRRRSVATYTARKAALS